MRNSDPVMYAIPKPRSTRPPRGRLKLQNAIAARISSCEPSSAGYGRLLPWKASNGGRNGCGAQRWMAWPATRSEKRNVSSQSR
jgi:hypothetical protein